MLRTSTSPSPCQRRWQTLSGEVQQPGKVQWDHTQGRIRVVYAAAKTSPDYVPTQPLVLIWESELCLQERRYNDIIGSKGSGSVISLSVGH